MGFLIKDEHVFIVILKGSHSIKFYYHNPKVADVERVRNRVEMMSYHVHEEAFSNNSHYYSLLPLITELDWGREADSNID